MGMASYYRSFIPNFSDLLNPIIHLTKKHVRFSWSPACEAAFNKLKQLLITSKILAQPKVHEPYKLYTDASNHAVGAVLTQDFPEGPRIIQYVSKHLSEGQRKWPTIEREAYAIIFAVNKLRHYLRGSQFTVFTDHKPLRSLFTSEMKNARIQRWAIILQKYGCDIHYHAVKLNVPADLVSPPHNQHVST